MEKKQYSLGHDAPNAKELTPEAQAENIKSLFPSLHQVNVLETKKQRQNNSKVDP